jgi:hypothetical protein
MARHIDKLWLLLLVAAIGVVAACSSDNSPADAGGDAPSMMSGG